uniref:Elongation factor Ts, mitochondrial n=1 Tax=Pseudo-nitzschia australis TaxID=44445 RepID=A0A7S4AVD8_9STRA
MMDCKKALIESDGDQDVAAEFLHKKGLAQADKKAARIAAEGKIAISNGADGKAVMVEVNCETDFVGKDALFLELLRPCCGSRQHGRPDEPRRQRRNHGAIKAGPYFQNRRKHPGSTNGIAR